jgi:hypothetical protein
LGAAFTQYGGTSVFDACAGFISGTLSPVANTVGNSNSINVAINGTT